MRRGIPSSEEEIAYAIIRYHVAQNKPATSWKPKEQYSAIYGLMLWLQQFLIRIESSGQVRVQVPKN